MNTAASCWAGILLRSRLPSEDTPSPQCTPSCNSWIMSHLTSQTPKAHAFTVHWHVGAHTDTHSHTHTHTHKVIYENAKLLLYHVIATGTCFATSWFPAHSLCMLNKSCTCIKLLFEDGSAGQTWHRQSTTEQRNNASYTPRGQALFFSHLFHYLQGFYKFSLIGKSQGGAHRGQSCDLHIWMPTFAVKSHKISL